MTLTEITPELMSEWGVCDSDVARIVDAYGGCESITPAEVLDLDLPAEDRLWAVLRPEVMGARHLRLAVCDLAERVLPLCDAQRPGDARPHRAISIARRYAAGEASADEMVAAGAAASAASSTADWVGAKEAAWAALAAARAADVYATWAPEAADAAAWAPVKTTSQDAAWDSVRAAARAAATTAVEAAWADAANRAVAWDAAWSAVQDAAWADAAQDAAWDAAREAEDAGMDYSAVAKAAAEAAAMAAAEAAAWSAERAAQLEIVRGHLLAVAGVGR